MKSLICIFIYFSFLGFSSNDSKRIILSEVLSSIKEVSNSECTKSYSRQKSSGIIGKAKIEMILFCGAIKNIKVRVLQEESNHNSVDNIKKIQTDFLKYYVQNKRL